MKIPFTIQKQIVKLILLGVCIVYIKNCEIGEFGYVDCAADNKHFHCLFQGNMLKNTPHCSKRGQDTRN